MLSVELDASESACIRLQLVLLCQAQRAVVCSRNFRRRRQRFRDLSLGFHCQVTKILRAAATTARWTADRCAAYPRRLASPLRAVGGLVAQPQRRITRGLTHTHALVPAKFREEIRFPNGQDTLSFGQALLTIGRGAMLFHRRAPTQTRERRVRTELANAIL